MKRWFLLWLLSIPVFLLSYVYSFFLAGKIAYLPQEECKPMFIFTPQDVGYCSDIYPVDVFLISLKTYPLSFVCVLAGLYIIGYPVYLIYLMTRKTK